MRTAQPWSIAQLQALADLAHDGSILDLYLDLDRRLQRPAATQLPRVRQALRDDVRTIRLHVLANLVENGHLSVAP